MNKKKVVSIEDRIPKLKEARKKKANRRLIIYLCAFFLLISIIVYLQSPLSYVKQIKVKGNHYLSNENVIKLSGMTTKTNIWTLDKQNKTKQLKSNSVIKSVNIQRKLPKTIILNIEERDVVGYVRKGSMYQPVVDNGSILNEKSKRMVGDAPLLNEFNKEATFILMTEQLGKLDPKIRQLVSEIYWEPEKDSKDKIRLFMNDGFVVQSSISDFADKMDVYPSIISQLDPKDKGIIHIGVGAYFESFK